MGRLRVLSGREVRQADMSKQVPCDFDGCAARVAIEDFDEAAWLPVFKMTREHMGFLCPAHVEALRNGLHAERYILTHSGPDELVIDKKPMPPKGATELG